MNDNEIIKTLEECGGVGDCEKCPLNELGGIDKCVSTLTQNALDLINRLKAEIEKLQTVKKHIHNSILIDCDYSTAEAYNSAFQKALKQLYDNANAKTEAIKEFAERLKSKKWTHHNFGELVCVEDIDDLVKEMAGEQE